MRGICVIIAAKDAAATIGRAVTSALSEPETEMVLVVDDGSADDTGGAARAVDDGSGRLRIERFEHNRGPSAARNHALSLVAAPYVAILDADDRILPGRFARMLAVPSWDMIADNIAFLPDTLADEADRIVIATLPADPRRIDFTTFVDGCVDRRSISRSQLGYLKPVLRMDMLRSSGIRYDERLRLGEDFVLYAALLAQGAVFMLLRSPGYLAIERPTSLSARHGVEELAAMLAAERGLADGLSLSGAERRSLGARIADTKRKHDLRRFLDTKRRKGPLAAAIGLGIDPFTWYGVAEGIARDKLRDARARSAPPPPAPTGARLLLP